VVKERRIVYGSTIYNLDVVSSVDGTCPSRCCVHFRGFGILRSVEVTQKGKEVVLMNEKTKWLYVYWENGVEHLGCRCNGRPITTCRARLLCDVDCLDCEFRHMGRYNLCKVPLNGEAKIDTTLADIGERYLTKEMNMAVYQSFVEVVELLKEVMEGK